jgi:hypothetical protein
MTVSLSQYGQPMDQGATTKRALATYTGPASYATGGEDGLAEACRLTLVWVIAGAVISNGTTILIGYYDAATAKLQWFDMAGVEVSALTALTGYTGTFEVIGR